MWKLGRAACRARPLVPKVTGAPPRVLLGNRAPQSYSRERVFHHPVAHSLGTLAPLSSLVVPFELELQQAFQLPRLLMRSSDRYLPHSLL